MRWAVVLAGGSGTRFWPLSTRARPKQMLPLVGARPLLAETLDRLAPLVPPERTLVLTSRALAEEVRRLLPALPAANVQAEPRAAGTAAALTWGAAEILRRAGEEATMLCVHADWAVGAPAEFRRSLSMAADVAEREQSLVTVGVVPSRADPGFGYIQPGDAVDGARRVTRFVEKPDREAAARMVQEGYLWNSGIFAWRAADLLAEVALHAPEVAPALPLARAGDLAGFFGAVTPISIDEGVLERSSRVLVVSGDFGWDDVGTWAALRRVRPGDAAGNIAAGDVHLVAARDNIVHAEGQTVVLYGVSDLVVVSRPGVTLVTTAERSADLKALLEALPASLRDPP